jgi:hypothetical protein
MNIPAVESQYVISLEEIFWGGTLVGITMAMHGIGMLSVLRASGGLKQRFERKPSLASGITILILSSWMIICVHLTEVMVWAAFFLWMSPVTSKPATRGRIKTGHSEAWDFITGSRANARNVYTC